jgi:hypothetical protein
MKTWPEKFMFYGAVVTIFLAIGLLLLFFYWMFYPYHIIDFVVPITVKNENMEVVRGETLYLETTYNFH